MKNLKVLLLALLWLCVPIAHESTIWTINAGSSVTAIQGVINGASSGDSIQFNPGTYNINAGMTMKCGVNMTATTPVAPSVGNPTNVIFSASFSQESTDVFYLASGCTTPTTVSYLSTLHGGLLFVNTPNSNLTFTRNYMGDLKCCSNQSYSGGLYIDSGNSSNTNYATNETITWNVFGDSTSCTTPQNGMTDTNSPEDIQGICTAVFIQTSVNGMLIENNTFYHVAEGVHLLCAGDNCSPPIAYIHNNIVAQFNEFNLIHRIPWEEQPQPSSGIVYQYNSEHDWFTPYYGSFGVSFACCGSGATTPYPIVSNNVIVFNSTPVGRYGYGQEDWGTGATYNNNWTGSANIGTSYGMAWGFGPVANMSHNTVCGQGFANAGYIHDEGYGAGTPTQTGNSTFTPCSAAASAPPTISPASGPQTGPTTVTISDLGYTTGSLPLGNTSIYYTTDGTTPTVNSTLYTGPFVVSSYPVTVRAIGMWGTGANAKSYPSGYGFVPSTVIAVNYTNAAPAVATPTFSPGSENYSTTLSVSIADATSGSTIYYTTDGTTPTIASSVYSSPITVTAPTTVVQAIGIKSGMSQSLTGSATYVNTAYVGTPTFTPPAENFTGTLSISIADATSGSSIYYTTDGSTPSTTGGGSSGATYYISPSGSDSNSGTSSGSPWLSPNHAVNCGDVIMAASGSYAASHFNEGNWGTVTCAAGNNVAWLKCATFDTCQISSSSNGIRIDKSYWGVQGWEVTTSSGTSSACFQASPNTTTLATVHHIIFANNVANGCFEGGIYGYAQNTTASVDYLAFIGNIAYNAAQGSGNCYSGISIYEPIASDTNPGTHIYVAGNFSYGNVDPNPCGGGTPTDGEAIIFDTFDGIQTGTPDYSQQAVAENNVGFFNGGRGFETYNNNNGTVVFRYNTAFGNMTDNNQTGGCFDRGDLGLQSVSGVTYDHNLAQTRTGTSCSSAAIYAFSILLGDATDVATNNWLYSAAGNNSLILSSTGFSLGAGNTLGTNPALSNPVNPGAPSCGSHTSVPDCMAVVVADYTPTVGGALPYGYQTPSLTPVANPYFPAWLCNTNLPAGLISTPCDSSELYTGAFTISATTTVKAIAAKSGFITSPVAAGTYTLSAGGVVATPTFSPDSETYSGSVVVTLADGTSGAAVYYTTDGSTPTTSSTLYSAPFTVMGGIGITTTVNAIGVKTGLTNSAVGTATYLNVPMGASTPTFSPDSESYTGTVTVAISDTTGGASIYYTRDGTTPTTASSLYSAPVIVATTTTLKAIAVASGFSNSAVGQATYVQTGPPPPPPPIIIPGPQMFSSTITATISAAPSTPGASIYYTIDGSQPTVLSTVYHGPILITGATTTVNAIEVYGSGGPSLVASCTYTFGSCPGCWWNQ